MDGMPPHTALARPSNIADAGLFVKTTGGVGSESAARLPSELQHDCTAQPHET